MTNVKRKPRQDPVTALLKTRRPRLAMATVFLLFLPGLGVSSVRAQEHPLDVGASYTYVRTNVLPDCNCFGLQGGSGEVQFGLSRRFSFVGDVSVGHKGGITQDNYTLTQSVFNAGVRYLPLHTRLRPFGDLLLGAAHTSGTLSPDTTGYGKATSFALQTGGGVIMQISPRILLKPVQADYLLTKFGNGVNDRQNDLRVSAGILFRLRR